MEFQVRRRVTRNDEKRDRHEKRELDMRRETDEQSDRHEKKTGRGREKEKCKSVTVVIFRGLDVF